MIFAAARNTELGKEGYQAVKGEAARLGRDPDHISICNILMPVTGATKAEAEDKMALISKLPLEIDALSLLAEALNFDFASKGIDEPFTTEELTGHDRHARHPRRRAASKQRQDQPERARLHQLQRPRPDRQRRRRRAQGDRRLHGGDVRRPGGCDGFVVAATHVPGAYADFVRHVIPEVQRRGLYHKDYAGKTLRENLGLPRPGVGAWKTRPPKAAE